MISCCLPPISKATARSPIQLERPVRVGDQSTVKRQGFCSGSGACEVDETVASITETVSPLHYAMHRIENGPTVDLTGRAKFLSGKNYNRRGR